MTKNTPELHAPGWAPASNSAIQLGDYLAQQSLETQVILDNGCGHGKNSRYLAALGHVVVGVDLELEAVKQAAQYDFSAYSSYVVADVRQPVFRKAFDAVIMNDITHLMPKDDSKKVLRAVRGLTLPGGINAVSGYLLTDEVESPKSLQQCFSKNELLQSYLNVGWDVIDYHEVQRPVQHIGQKEWISSFASVLAKKPR